MTIVCPNGSDICTTMDGAGKKSVAHYKSNLLMQTPIKHNVKKN
jgi:hypothetical protein